jgi:hypothetical protein
MNTQKHYSRRDFLKRSLLGLGGIVLLANNKPARMVKEFAYLEDFRTPNIWRGIPYILLIPYATHEAFPDATVSCAILGADECWHGCERWWGRLLLEGPILSLG